MAFADKADGTRLVFALELSRQWSDGEDRAPLALKAD
jgi:hypothetical protein